MKTFLKVDYKGKYFVIQDEMYEQDYFTCGTITKEEALKPEFVEEHKEFCNYYGIPCYIGKDKEMSKVYKKYK